MSLLGHSLLQVIHQLPLPTSRLPSPRPRPRPPQHSIVHPFGTSPRRGKGRSSSPGRKVGQSSSCRKGRKKEGRKEVANRRRWNPVGGLCIVLTPFLFSSAKSSPRSSQNQGSAAISQNPSWDCLPEPEGDHQKLWGAY